MEWTTGMMISISAMVFVAAVIFAAHGHGGACGYLAVLSLSGVTGPTLAGTALILNCLVAAIAMAAWWRKKRPEHSLLWLLLLSVPAAFTGALLPVSERFYNVTLALVLLWAALRLWVNLAKHEALELQSVNMTKALGSGAVIGLTAGLTGTGGGTFFSPLLVKSHWAKLDQAAASAMFVLANSLAGLGGRVVMGTAQYLPSAGLILAAILGGTLGAYFGQTRPPGPLLRRVMAAVLALAATKLLGMAL